MDACGGICRVLLSFTDRTNIQDRCCLDHRKLRKFRETTRDWFDLLERRLDERRNVVSVAASGGSAYVGRESL